MNTKVTIKTIATDLGLTTGTVSRVLNGKAKQFRISKKTVDIVESYAKKKGYSPNLIAKGLQASKTFTIGLMIPDIANPFFSLMAKYIERAASNANYSIILVDAEEDINKEILQVKNLIGRKVDGIIAAPVGKSFEHFTEITQLKIPLIFIDRYFKNNPITYITSDNYKGAFEATNLLINNGHKDIALIKGDEIIEPVIERRKGYLDALNKSNININNNLIIGNGFSIENGYQSTLKLLQLTKRPTAIFAMSNLIGLGVLQAIKESGLSIYEDISLIIFDDQPYMSFLNPPVTTVKQNTEKIGELAIECILQKIDNANLITSSVVVPVDIIIRESVKKII